MNDNFNKLISKLDDLIDNCQVYELGQTTVTENTLKEIKTLATKLSPVSNENTTSSFIPQDTIPAACQGCSSHPSNGGTGICSCTLGDVYDLR